MIRTAKVIFCDNEHGTGEVTFPSLDRETYKLQRDYVEPHSIATLRKAARQAGWGRVNGADYCPACMET